jgi:hypothetical protein
MALEYVQIQTGMHICMLHCTYKETVTYDVDRNDAGWMRDPGSEVDWEWREMRESDEWLLILPFTHFTLTLQRYTGARLESRLECEKSYTWHLKSIITWKAQSRVGTVSSMNPNLNVLIRIFIIHTYITYWYWVPTYLVKSRSHHLLTFSFIHNGFQIKMLCTLLVRYYLDQKYSCKLCFCSAGK